MAADRDALMKTAALALLAAMMLNACAAPTPAPREKPDYTPVPFAALDGWREAAALAPLSAFEKSCTAFAKKTAPSAAPWQQVCAALSAAPPRDEAEARAFFETHFTPYRINGGEKGLFTGYYEAQLHGSLTAGGPYQTPLYGRPTDMFTADLGRFKGSLKGQKITGKVSGKEFIPYDDRAAIAAGSLAGRAEPLLWVDDPIAAFFLEVQGSGQVAMADGSVIRVGFEAQNGHAYTPIGRVLAARGAIEKPVTMQKIRAWLAAHPDEAQGVMNENASAVFFRRAEQDGAVGAQGVVLTPMHSLAVDPAAVPLGAPVWLESERHRRLVIAQDTGGAIKGAVRGDLFWGAGAAAEEGAGAMQEEGVYDVLLPKGAAP